MNRKIKKVMATMLAILLIITSMPLIDVTFKSKAANSIQIGDVITLGTYNGSPIEWICVDINELGPLMLAKDVLCKKAFDAAGTNSTYHVDGWGYIRAKYGSNCWQDSNIRQWLNSDETTVSWTHCPPSSGKVTANPYNNESGFLTNFTEYEKTIIKSTKRIINVNPYETKRSGYCDGGSTYMNTNYFTNSSLNVKLYYYKNIEDSIFLLSAKEFNSIYFSNRDYLKASSEYWLASSAGITKDCFEHVASVSTAVLVDSPRAYEGTIGIRPAFYLNEENWKNRTIVPSGYDYYEDSYSFSNPTVSEISEKYFTTMFKPKQGKELYQKKKNVSAGGLCHGIAYTTAAIYNGLPDCSQIYNHDEGACENIRDINKNKSRLKIGDLDISIGDYIKYAFIYQWSAEHVSNIPEYPIEVRDFVQDCAENNQLGVTINLEKYKDKDKTEVKGAHTVLAVGVEGNDILIDDSNFKGGISKDELKRLTINDDGTWSYNGSWDFGTVDSSNSVFGIGGDYDKPYYILLTGEKVDVREEIIQNSNETSVETESYVIGMDRLSKDKVLIYADSENYNINCENLIEVSNDFSSAENEPNDEEIIDNGTFYWADDKQITISDITGADNEFFITGEYITIGVKTNKTSSVTLSMDEINDVSTKIDTEKGKEYTVFVETLDDNEEDIITSITGTASGDIVTATETETGVAVEGFDDMTITYETPTGNDTEEIKHASGQKINILTDEENSDVSTDYVCDHADEDNNCICDYCEDALAHTEQTIPAVPATCTTTGLTAGVKCSVCGEILTEQTEIPVKSHNNVGGKCSECDYDFSDDCSHLCHKSGFIGFIWKIINFFQKLFKINPVCSCGKAHY